MALEEEEYVDSAATHGEADDAERGFAPPPTAISATGSGTPSPRASTFRANSLACFGLVVTAAGAVMLASRHMPAEVQSLAAKVQGYGVSFDVVCAAGLILFAAGFVGRAIAQVSRQVTCNSDDQVDLALVVDQLLADMTDLRAGIDQMALAPEDDQESTAEAIAGQNEKDALFRMAASLDQLGGRLSKRVATDLSSLKGELDRLATGTERLVARIEDLESRSTAPVEPVEPVEPVAQVAQVDPVEPKAQAFEAAPPRAPEPTPAPPTPPAAPVADPFATPEVEVAQEESPFPAPDAQPAVDAQDESREVEEDQTVVVDLDAPEDGLGLLDRLEQEVEGKEQPAPTIDLYDPPPALPKPAPEQTETPQTYENSLDRLLPDDNVRDAIDGSR